MHSRTIALLAIIALTACSTGSKESSTDLEPRQPEEEVFYLIFPRSFYDSNKDGIGDLNGVTQKLDYLQKLGITSIIMTPLYPSEYYHNYFANSFEGIDEEYGTMEDYLNMVRAIHKRGMKFYMDTEMQYVTINHPWFRDSFRNPDSEYADYIFYKDSLNKEPYSIIFDMTGIPSYNGEIIKAATVDLYNAHVRQYIWDLYGFWLDPNKDGNFEDGVDGFRLDHAMDDLDNKGLLTNMFSEFWKPLAEHIRSVNPEAMIIAEQADWNDPGYGFFSDAGVDIVYSFGLTFSMFEKEKFEATLNDLWTDTPSGKYHFLFLDNHDTDRIASTLKGDMELYRQKATMLYLAKGIPFIYYGQELGMTGTSGRDYDVVDPGLLGDGNDIPRRQAFEWSADIEKTGMATWYKDVEPYWGQRQIRTGDGISVEEQSGVEGSLLTFYQTLFSLRAANPGLSAGNARVIANPNPSVLTYVRWKEGSKFILIFNFAEETSDTEIFVDTLPFETKNVKIVLGDWKSTIDTSEVDISVSLAGKGYLVLKAE